jgi:uncharacterized protein YndB with AHSA1/START domain
MDATARESDPVSMKNRTTVKRKSERELVVTRTIHGPARIVFDAFTKPELLKRWWAPKSTGLSLLSCEADVRVGGRYRFVFVDAASKPLGEFFGRYIEVTPHLRLVWTNEEGGDGGAVSPPVAAPEEKKGSHVDLGRARSSPDRTQGGVMKYLAFVRHPESIRQSPPPPGFMEVMGQFVQRCRKDGSLVDTGGLLPSKDGARIRVSSGNLTVTDGPFSESKELIGGWAILQGASKADVMRVATEFMELHRKHWPGFEGESEVRPMFDPGMGP